MSEPQLNEVRAMKLTATQIHLRTAARRLWLANQHLRIADAALALADNTQSTAWANALRERYTASVTAVEVALTETLLAADLYPVEAGIPQ